MPVLRSPIGRSHRQYTPHKTRCSPATDPRTDLGKALEQEFDDRELQGESFLGVGGSPQDAKTTVYCSNAADEL